MWKYLTILHFLCSCSYLFTFLLSSQFYWHICLKSAAYFFWPTLYMHSVSGAVQMSCLLCRCLQCFWRCWLGGRKGIRPVKNWVVACLQTVYWILAASKDRVKHTYRKIMHTQNHKVCSDILLQIVVTWLSVWSDVQTCIWPSWRHCHSLSLASVKSTLALPFLYRLTRVVPGH